MKKCCSADKLSNSADDADPLRLAAAVVDNNKDETKPINFMIDSQQYSKYKSEEPMTCGCDKSN